MLDFNGIRLTRARRKLGNLGTWPIHSTAEGALLGLIPSSGGIIVRRDIHDGDPSGALAPVRSCAGTGLIQII
ncbi:hypothetical protein BDV59DRAFT_175760 [Aspergillus ambiguus]|uniref:uncharacterized protein n=1 Tax=Aspergillus ambiguus TaxID=176160 RepID=UPI003CCCD89B